MKLIVFLSVTLTSIIWSLPTTSVEINTNLPYGFSDYILKIYNEELQKSIEIYKKDIADVSVLSSRDSNGRLRINVKVQHKGEGYIAYLNGTGIDACIKAAAARVESYLLANVYESFKVFLKLPGAREAFLMEPDWEAVDLVHISY
jgi:hypothetical protein